MGWVTGVLLVALAATFLVVYEQTGSRLRAQIGEDVRGDLVQLTETVRSLHATTPSGLARRLRAYVAAEPFTTTRRCCTRPSPVTGP